VSEKHFVTSYNAELIWDWRQNRGGIAIWRSIDLSDPGKSWTTPAQEEDGSPKAKQHWQMADKPDRIITDPAEVEVHVPKEVDRFHVAIERGSGLMRFQLTDGSTRKVRRRVEKANEKHCNGEKLAWYEFDYSVQDAVILVPDRQVPIEEYINELAREVQGAAGRTGRGREGSRASAGKHAEGAAGSSGSQS
jgi:hypothetical protein